MREKFGKRDKIRYRVELSGMREKSRDKDEKSGEMDHK